MTGRVIRRVVFKAVAALATTLVALGLPGTAAAEGRFIAAPDRVDVVHDGPRQLLYISSGSDVLRYDLVAGQFLSPFRLGGTLRGMDLSPDGNTLAVADNAYNSQQNWVHLVDLEAGTSEKKYFTREYYEGGTFTAAWGSDNRLLVSSQFQGSGGVPLRRYDPANGAVATLGSINQNSMLTASADRSIIGIAESNSSGGPWGRYRVSDGNLVRRTGYTDGTSSFNYEIGVSRDGGQFLIPRYSGAYVYDSAYAVIQTIGQSAGPQPIGVVYHPTKDVVYVAWADTSQVLAFDTANFDQVGTFDFEYTFDHPGNNAFQWGRLKIAADGSLLFGTVGGGVRYVGLLPDARDLALTLRQNSTNNRLATDTSAANFSGPVTISIVSGPAQGTATVNADNSISYTPNPGFVGSDAIEYQATDGTDSDTGAIALTVAAFGALDDSYVQLRDNCCADLYFASNDFGFANPVTVTIVSPPDQGGTVYLRNSPGTRSGIHAEYYRSSSSGRPIPYTEKFTYRITDGTLTDTATVTIRVVDYLVQDDTATTNLDEPVTIHVGANDVGFNYNPVVAGLYSYAQHGSLVLLGSPGYASGIQVRYTPDPGFEGVDTFQYAIDDGDRIGIATVTVAVIPDADHDGIDDARDNCLGLANPDQRDANGDGYGSLCDADLNDDGRVNFADLAILRQRFGTSDDVADLDGNGYVNFGDLARLKLRFGRAPGPSAVAP